MSVFWKKLKDTGAVFWLTATLFFAGLSTLFFLYDGPWIVTGLGGRHHIPSYNHGWSEAGTPQLGWLALSLAILCLVIAVFAYFHKPQRQRGRRSLFR